VNRVAAASLVIAQMDLAGNITVVFRGGPVMSLFRAKRQVMTADAFSM
tara:strand:- start:351 stop:494 length:144 start_codon:yes stop_codon:yes gene_type:complete